MREDVTTGQGEPGRCAADGGVDLCCLAALGYGEDDPVASNESPQGRRLKRRVTILLRAKAT
jgi:outer membrane protein OmpA-like peptidoglycan-associated protein